MTFPSTIRTDQASGYPGDLAVNYPPVAQTGILNSADAAYNVVGRVFTHTSTEGVFAAGGTGAFAGILSERSQYAGYGTTAGGPLAASTTLPNGAIGDFVTEHPGIFVDLVDAAAPGYYVTYNKTTGVLGAVPQGTNPDAGHVILPGAFVVRYTNAAPGLAVISLGTNTTAHIGGA